PRGRDAVAVDFVLVGLKCRRGGYGSRLTPVHAGGSPDITTRATVARPLLILLVAIGAVIGTPAVATATPPGTTPPPTTPAEPDAPSETAPTTQPTSGTVPATDEKPVPATDEEPVPATDEEPVPSTTVPAD